MADRTTWTVSGNDTASVGVAAIIDAAKERWVQGSTAFIRLLSSANASHRPNAKTIRSAVYGDMRFSATEMLFVESFYMQRMRRISQMGLMNLVYPDARHSRFEHSLGVLHCLKGLLDFDDQARDHLPEDTKRTLFFAALLHDCGHGPFSHTTETLLELAGLSLQMRPANPGDSPKLKPHERRGRSMILDGDFHLENLGIDSYGLKTALKDVAEVEPQLVVDLIVGKEPSPMVNLLSGDFDVDKMDYFQRDAFFTGTLGGGVDMEALRRWIRVYKDGDYPRAAFDRRAVGHVLHMLLAREHVYSITAFHHAARIAAALLLVACDMALRVLPTDAAALLYSNIELLDDQELVSLLQMAGSIAAGEDPKGERALLRRTTERVYMRWLPKRLFTLTRTEFIERFREAIPYLEADSGELTQIAYCRISDIGGGKYTRYLQGQEIGDDLAILDLSPRLGPAVESLPRGQNELATLQGISIYTAPNRVPESLGDWLNANVGEKAAENQAAGLRAYKLALWRALVLVPASLRLGLSQSPANMDKFVADFAEALKDEKIRRPWLTENRHAAAAKKVNETVRTWRALQMERNAVQLERESLGGGDTARRNN